MLQLQFVHQIILLCMLNKYQNFIKISKSKECSFYYAFNKENLQKVLIKRIKQSTSWDDLLANKHLKFQSKQTYFQKKIQIFKDKGYFFIVYQRPNGYPIIQLNRTQKLELTQFYTIFFGLAEAIQQMLKNIEGLYIYPQWVFTHRNNIKICHFQPFFPQSNNQSNSVHVYMFDAQKKSLNPQHHISDSGVFSFQKNKNIVLNLGLIAYHLITGRACKKIQTKQQYQAQLKSLQLNAEKRIYQCTKDQQMSKFITNMLKCNPQSEVEFKSIFNMFKRKALQNRPKSIQFINTVSIQMEKIKLHNPNSIKTFKKKRNYRPCCKKFQDEEAVQQQKVRSQQKIIKSSKIPIKAKIRSKQKFPQINGIKTNRHVSCFFPQLNTNNNSSNNKLILQNTNLSRPTMFRSVDTIRHRIKN